MGKIDALVDEGLTHLVVRGIVEVLGGEGRGVNGREPRISPLDDVALNQLHQRLPSPPSLLPREQAPRSCVSRDVTRRAERRTSTRWPSDPPASLQSRSQS